MLPVQNVSTPTPAAKPVDKPTANAPVAKPARPGDALVARSAARAALPVKAPGMVPWLKTAISVAAFGAGVVLGIASATASASVGGTILTCVGLGGILVTMAGFVGNAIAEQFIK